MWGQWCNIAKEAASRAFLVTKFLGLLHVTDTYLLSTSIVHGPSMLPTLNMRGDVILMDKLSHRFGKVEAGDVVFVKSPQNPSRVLTKRVLGLEGDVVSYDSCYGIPESLVVPKGHVWIQGDNIYASNDSRHFGAVPYGLILGKALCRLPHHLMMVCDAIVDFGKRTRVAQVIWPLAEFGTLGP